MQLSEPLLLCGLTLFSGNKPESHVPDRELQKAKTPKKYQRDSSPIDPKETEVYFVAVGGWKGGCYDYLDSGKKFQPYDTRQNQAAHWKRIMSSTRTVTQRIMSYTTYKKSSNGSRFHILKKTEPEVRGVLVVAEGADNIVVRERIINAVTVALDIPLHRVEVVQRKK